MLDELHMIDDEHRGYIIELVGAKLLSLEHDVQITGMSGTISVNLIFRSAFICFTNIVIEHRPYGPVAGCSLIRNGIPTDPN